MATGAVWGAGLWWRRRKRFVIALVLVAATAGQAVWYFVLARYDTPQGAPDVGAKAPGLASVRVRDGATFRLGAQQGHGVLLVFYRGPW